MSRAKKKAKTAPAPPAPVVDVLPPGDKYEVDEVEDEETWTRPMSKPWEDVFDEEGRPKDLSMMRQNARKRRMKEADSGHVLEKGMIRYLYLILDFSSAMERSDIKPNRRVATLQLVEDFVKEYFDQNPISQLGMIVSHDKEAEKVTELSGNPKQQVEQLKAKLESRESGGEMTLQNSLEIAKGALCQIPSYGSREVLVIMGSLSTCDPGDILSTISTMAKLNIRCSVLSLAAEVYICKRLAEETQGRYHVALSRDHYRELLLDHVPPLPLIQRTKAKRTHEGTKPSSSSNPEDMEPDRTRRWIHMGFPQQYKDAHASLCACHIELQYDGFFCPQCKTKLCELPTDCLVCGLTLVSSPHLARSYHHLFPVPYFAPVASTDPGWKSVCSGCQATIDPTADLCVQCPRCRFCFCVDCDEYIHQSLHNCSGCHSTSATATAVATSAPVHGNNTNTTSSSSSSSSFLPVL